MISNLLKSKRNKKILTGGTLAIPLSSRYAYFAGFFVLRPVTAIGSIGKKCCIYCKMLADTIDNTPAMPMPFRVRTNRRVFLCPEKRGMSIFDKPAFSTDQHIAQWVERGLAIPDKAQDQTLPECH